MQTIKKRDGRILDFDPAKITAAMEKAMRVVRGMVDHDQLQALTARVCELFETRYPDEMPDVERIQDMVEQALMEAGLFDVAKAYILYRERRRKVREDRKRSDLNRLRSGQLMITKRDGTSQPFDEHKLRHYFQHAVDGYEGVVQVAELVELCEQGFYEGISTDEIAHLATMTAKNFIERDPGYSEITARLFMQSLYREVFDAAFDNQAFAARYRGSFSTNLMLGVKNGRLNKALLDFDLARLADALDPERDRLLGQLGLQTLYDRYFQRDESGRRLETPQMFWMRVAMGLALNEEDREGRATQFYNILSNLRFVCSTPTLFHSGTNHPQLSSCYLTTVEDDLTHIFKSLGDNAQLSKWSGGLGNDWTSIRATGAMINTTGVNSQGVIPFLKIANDTTVAINRSGKRRGATCAYLETWHLDIEDFLDLRRNTGDERRRTHDMNTANWIPDLFIKRVINNEDWTLFSPDETPDLHQLYGRRFEQAYAAYEEKADRGEVRLFKKVSAAALWKKMITRLFETGHPWITFKDPCNVRSPQDHVGIVHSSNLCTEITLNTSADETAVCNLGSINLPRHIINGHLDRHLLAETVRVAMRMLDNVIDINYYPTSEARQSNLKHRPVGLGLMGFQDALFMLGINFDSDEMVRFADESMELISYNAILSSSHLAAERGAYDSFIGSKWDRGLLPIDTIDQLESERGLPLEIDRTSRLDWTPVRDSIAAHGMRNSNCLAIAPTATIANISGCYPSIEPVYKNLYVKSNMSGEFTVINRYLVNDLKARGLWNQSMLEDLKARDGSIQEIGPIPTSLKEKYKEAFEIDAEWIIKAAAHRGKWIDQSQSLNIFLATNSGRRISDIYLYAWRTGLKTTYYLRTLAASGVEKSTVSINKAYTTRGAAQATGAPALKRGEEDTTAAESPETKMIRETVAACNIDDPDCEACQ